MPIDQRIAQAEILRHTCHSVVDRRVAMGMILPQHLADDAGRFFVRSVGPQAQVKHSVENAPLNRFESIAGVGQSARDDDAHRVIQIGGAHLVLDVYRFYSADIKFQKSTSEVGVSYTICLKSLVTNSPYYTAKT